MSAAFGAITEAIRKGDRKTAVARYPDTRGALVLRAPGTTRRFATVLEPLSGTPATVSRLMLEGNQVLLKRTDGSQRRYEWSD